MCPMPLTPKQERFVEEYLIDLNATQAAIRAGYSKKSAKLIGHENITKPDIAGAIQEAKEKRAARTEISQDRVLREYACVGFYDIGQFVDENDKLLPIHEIPEDARRAICGIEGTGKDRKLKLPNKQPALKDMGTHLGMFEQKEDPDKGGLCTSEDLADLLVAVMDAASRRQVPGGNGGKGG